MCKGITKKGIPCKRSPMAGVAYCYIHSIGKFRGIPLFKNFFVQLIAIVSLIFGFISVYQGCQGASKKGQEEIKDNQTTIFGRVGEIHADLEGIDTRLASIETQLNKVLEKDGENLSKKYASGYILFAIDSTKSVFPSRSTVSKDYVVNWDSTMVLEVTSEHIDMVLPNIYYRPLGNMLQSNIIRISRYPIHQVITYPIKVFPEEIFLEIMSDEQNEIVLVVGFGEDTWQKKLTRPNR